MENKFIDGLMAKKPHENAPDFVKAKISIKREELIKTLQGMDCEWLNADLKESKEGKYYVAIDDWKPEKPSEAKNEPNKDTSEDSISPEDIPF
jgi:hypothetical protein